MMQKRTRNLHGFTLIELMIVVAIIGILAAIAVPNFMSMQLRSKRTELPTNLDAIRTTERAYMHEWDAYTTCIAKPTAFPTKTQAVFGPTFGDNSDWDLLGWIADGKVRGQYAVVAITGAASNQNFSASAASDVDGDGNTAAFGADRDIKSVMISQNSVY